MKLFPIIKRKVGLILIGIIALSLAFPIIKASAKSSFRRIIEIIKDNEQQQETETQDTQPERIYTEDLESCFNACGRIQDCSYVPNPYHPEEKKCYPKVVHNMCFCSHKKYLEHWMTHFQSGVSDPSYTYNDYAPNRIKVIWTPHPQGKVYQLYVPYKEAVTENEALEYLEEKYDNFVFTYKNSYYDDFRKQQYWIFNAIYNWRGDYR